MHFGFSENKKEEMAALIQRYGTTATGIGRMIIQMGRNRIWREPVTISFAEGAPAGALVPLPVRRAEIAAGASQKMA